MPTLAFGNSLFISANSITSEKDLLVKCNANGSSKLKDCIEIEPSLAMRNPIAIAANNNHLFIANYGHKDFGRTSYVEKCDFPQDGQSKIDCRSVLAIGNDAHVTGLEVVGNKFYFTQSFSYNNNINFNYLVACDIVEGKRTPECGPIHLLKSNLKNPLQGFNRQMDIRVTNQNIFVSDYYGGTVSKCTLPNVTNEVECAPMNQESKGDIVYPLSFDVNENRVCELNKTDLLSLEPARIECCNDNNNASQCIQSQDEFINPISLRLNADGSSLYVIEHGDIKQREKVVPKLSICSLHSENTFSECKELSIPYKSLNGHRENVGNISAFKLVE